MFQLTSSLKIQKAKTIWDGNSKLQRDYSFIRKTLKLDEIDSRACTPERVLMNDMCYIYFSWHDTVNDELSNVDVSILLHSSAALGLDLRDCFNSFVEINEKNLEQAMNKVILFIMQRLRKSGQVDMEQIGKIYY